MDEEYPEYRILRENRRSFTVRCPNKQCQNEMDLLKEGWYAFGCTKCRKMGSNPYPPDEDEEE
jgi:hypothetical protein